MAAAVARAGFALHVWARRLTWLDGLSDVPYVGHEDLPSLAAASDVVGLCVGTDEDGHPGPDHRWAAKGSATGLGPGESRDRHAVTPSDTRRCAPPPGVDVLDALVSGGRPAATERRLTTMVGGPPTAVERCQQVFDASSRHVVHVGGPASGQTAKVFNITLMMLHQVAIADTFELADGFGMDPGALFAVLKLGSAGSTVLSCSTG